MLAGVTLVVTNFFVTYEPGIDAKNWSDGANTAFFILSRTTCCIGWMIIAFYIFFGWSKMGRNFLGNTMFNTLGKIVFLAYLISPIIMMMVYSNQERGVFMTLVGNTYLGIGHLLVTFILGFFIYLLVEWQLKRFFEVFVINPYLSHD